MANVLIIDDEEAITGALASFLSRSAGHAVTRAHSGREGLDAFERVRPDVVLLDLWLPDVNGLEVLSQVSDGDAVVIMITGGADVPVAVEAMKGGAENFLTKPLELPHLGLLVERAVEKARLRKMSRYMSARRGAALGPVGVSPTMRDLTEQIEMLARSDRTTVLILGEGGSGKGRVAEYIHAHSPRSDRPFVEVNCAALTASSLDSELFGIERSLAAMPGGPAGGGGGGASAGARPTKPGLFEVADGGTLFLDEIGDLDHTLQPKLLRVLEGKSFRRLNGTDDITTNVRLIAATNKDLVNEVTAGNFREDLYYRLSVMPVYLPPLRARSREDLVQLVASVYQDLRPQLPDSPPALADEALERLLAYSWPGNIRELRNVLERAMLMARGSPRILPAHLPAEVRAASGGGGGSAGGAGERHVPRTLDEVERAHIERTLRAHNANRTHAAKELGISRATLIKKIKQYALDGKR
ncbi:MAG TPA: sigma-54 dependent transcriptional regulator [Gemmatimonadaceae bacterium]|nr:sigma-54 dependent transcriptional regulator [Gemmatimonadaceae bacterium]